MRVELNAIFYFIIEWERKGTGREQKTLIQGESSSHMITSGNPENQVSCSSI